MSERRPADASLAGQLVIVTGASRGIGAAIAERLGSAGATVVAAARTLKADDAHSSAEAVVRRITQRGGDAVALPLDLEQPDSREALVHEVVARFGRIDVLVNNGGTAAYRATDAMPLATAIAQTQAYFLGPWHLCSLVLPVMKGQGGGRILNIGSCVADPPTRPYEAYNAARGHEALYAGLKTGFMRFSQGLAAEVAADYIAVDVLAPVGAVLTPGVAALDLGLTPDMEICEPVEDMAEAALAILERPLDETGAVEFSYRLLDSLGRPSRSLDASALVRSRSHG